MPYKHTHTSGNVLNGTIGKQMVDTLVESAGNVEMILQYFKLFLNLPGEEVSYVNMQK